MASSMRLDGARVRQARKHKKLTRERLAELAGVSVSTLQRAERGDPIQEDCAELIADALGVSVVELIAADEPCGAESEQDLIEREAEWARLDIALRRARSGQLALVLVSGEAGVGKTALLRKLFAEARALDARVLLGEGSQFERTRFAFDPFVAAFREHLPVFEELLDPSAYDALQSFVHRRLEGGSDLARRARLFDVIAQALIELSRRQCVVFAIDDLQWVDEDSLELFESLARRVVSACAQAESHCALLLVASQRTIDAAGVLVGAMDDRATSVDATLRSVLDRLDRLPLLERLLLRGLTPAGVRTLIKRLGIERPAVQLVDTIHGGTGGNPLFVRHLVEDLLTGDQLFDQEGFTNARLTPEELHIGRFVVAIAARAGRLPAPCRNSFVWAAFMGPRIDAERCAAVLGIPVQHVRDHLHEGVRQGLLEQVGDSHAFRHPLLRATFYQLASVPTADVALRVDDERIATSRPRERHRFVAERLMQLLPQSDPAEIAHHLLRAGDEAPAALTLRFCKAQADRDFDACAWTNAARHYEAAIAAGRRLGVANDELGMLYLRAGLAHNYAFEAGASLQHYREALRAFRDAESRTGEAHALSRLVRFSDNVGESGGEQAERISKLEQLVNEMDGTCEDHRLMGDMFDVLATCASSAGDPERALALARRAEAIGLAHGDDLLLAQVTTALCLSLMEQLKLREARERWLQGLAYDRRSSDVSKEARHLQRLPLTLFALGLLDEANHIADDAAQVSERAGNSGEVSLAYATQVAIAAVRGDVAAARRRVSQVEECIERSRYVWSGPNAYLAWAYAQLLKGDLRGANATLKQLAQPGFWFTANDGTSGFERVSSRFRALIAAYSPGEAAPSPMRSSRPPRSPDAVRFRDLAYLCARVQIGALLGQPAFAAGLEAALEQADASGVVFTQGWPFLLPRVLGVACALSGRPKHAVHHLERAIVCASELGATPELVHARLDCAGVLLSQGDVPAARNHLRHGRVLLEESPLRMPHLRRLADAIAKQLRL